MLTIVYSLAINCYSSRFQMGLVGVQFKVIRMPSLTESEIKETSFNMVIDP